MNKHKWYNEIVAWAEGKTIQFRYKSNSFKWKDFDFEPTPPFNNVDLEFRVKPNTVKYRLYLCNYTDVIVNYVRMVYCSNDKNEEYLASIKVENNPSFGKWLTDWIELEIGDIK